MVTEPDRLVHSSKIVIATHIDDETEKDDLRKLDEKEPLNVLKIDDIIIIIIIAPKLFKTLFKPKRK